MKFDKVEFTDTEQLQVYINGIFSKMIMDKATKEEFKELKQELKSEIDHLYDCLEYGDTLSFEEILPHLKDGKKCFRTGWNGTQAGINMYVYVVENSDTQYPTDISMNHQHYQNINLDKFLVFYHEKNNTTNVWIPLIWDIFNDDWVVKE